MNLCEDCGTPLTETNKGGKVHWPGRGEGPYDMCDMCFHHSIKNRGAEEYKEPPRQTIRVDALGRMVTAHKDDNPVDFRKLGKQRIDRFSEVLHDEGHDKFYIVFRESAPDWVHGVPFNRDMYEAFLLTGPDQEDVVIYEGSRHMLALFDTYADAVACEQRVLNVLMERGEMD